MSIRSKLILSYAAMLFVPLLLILLISLLLVLFFQGSLQNVRAIYEQTENVFDREEVAHVMNEMERTIIHNPSLISNTAYLNDVSSELRAHLSGLILRTDDRLVYVSPYLHDQTQLAGGLPPYKANGYEARLPSIWVGNDLYIGSRFDFETGGGRLNSIFFWSKIDPLTFFARRYFPMLFVILIIVLILTHSLLTYLMSKTIIKPLQRLREAATQIKEGNLDFKVGVDSKDEIGQLSIAFEEMREQLQHSIVIQQQYENNRKELITSISHDLKTPITAIRGYVDGLLEGVADTPEKSRRYTRTISAKVEELDRLIDELFLYSKLDLNRLPFNFEAVSIGNFLSDWVEELAFEMEKKDIRLHTNIRIHSDVIIALDLDKFRRVLTNVVDNSVKYMDKHNRTIHVNAYEEGTQAVISVTDTGSGIEAAALPHIFERFYRAEASRSTQTGGTGLGLAIAKQLMLGHGGDITAESKKGVGTTISITLPILEHERTDPSEETNSVDRG